MIKAHRLLYYSTRGLWVIKKKKKNRHVLHTEEYDPFIESQLASRK